jgi:hypothetical protein
MTDDLKRRLQDFFGDGLVTILGLGHSAAYDLPTMPELAEGLNERVPALISADKEADWEKVRDALDEGRHLEEALELVDHESPLIETLVNVTADLIADAESKAVRSLIHDGARFPLAELIPHLIPNNHATMVTTNYDRLAEIAVESAGFFLDCSFVGMHWGRADSELSKTSLRSAAVARKGGFTFRYRPYIRLAKPHGSLDWYLYEGRPIRSPFALDLPRLMITPGTSKFRKGYERPFDHHREIGNHAIDRATSFLAIGYGFNDPHLQTHLAPAIEGGAPCLILTKTLSPAALELVEKGSGVIALEASDSDGTRLHEAGETIDLDNVELWKLETFIDEVLR